MESRQSYATRHRQRYLSWVGEIAESPYTPLDKLEFAVISAHTPQAQAITAWYESRIHHNLAGLDVAFWRAGILAPKMKAQRIVQLRRLFRADEVVLPEAVEYETFRRNTKLPGLGICKLSFGLALVSPLTSPVVCLDVHVLRAFGEDKPGRAWGNLKRYETIEARLKAEAIEVGLPPFAYQWAVWDYQRQAHHQAPDDHSFLWRSGPTHYQPSLFGG